MLYNFLWDDVGRKQIKLQKKNQPHVVELVESPTTSMERPVTIYADGERLHTPTTPRERELASKMDFKFPFTGGSLGVHSPAASPAMSQQPRFSSATTSRLTL